MSIQFQNLFFLSIVCSSLYTPSLQCQVPPAEAHCSFYVAVLQASGATAREVCEAASAGDVERLTRLLSSDPSLINVAAENV